MFSCHTIGLVSPILVQWADAVAPFPSLHCMSMRYKVDKDSYGELNTIRQFTQVLINSIHDNRVTHFVT